MLNVGLDSLKEVLFTVKIFFHGAELLCWINKKMLKKRYIKFKGSLWLIVSKMLEKIVT